MEASEVKLVTSTASPETSQGQESEGGEAINPSQEHSQTTQDPSLGTSLAPSPKASQVTPSLMPSLTASQDTTQTTTQVTTQATTQVTTQATAKAVIQVPSMAPSLAPSLAPSQPSTQTPRLSTSLAPTQGDGLTSAQATTQAPSLAPSDSILLRSLASDIQLGEQGVMRAGGGREELEESEVEEPEVKVKEKISDEVNVNEEEMDDVELARHVLGLDPLEEERKETFVTEWPGSDGGVKLVEGDKDLDNEEFMDDVELARKVLDLDPLDEEQKTGAATSLSSPALGEPVTVKPHLIVENVTYSGEKGVSPSDQVGEGQEGDRLGGDEEESDYLDYSAYEYDLVDQEEQTEAPGFSEDYQEQGLQYRDYTHFNPVSSCTAPAFGPACFYENCFYLVPDF